MLWIRIVFSADPDPAFYLSADSDADPDSQTSWSDFKITKKWVFTCKNMLKIGKRQKNILTKSFFENRKPGLFVNFCQFPWSWIRIRIHIPNTDPEKTAWIPDPDTGAKKAPDRGSRIRNTDKKLSLDLLVSLLHVFGVVPRAQKKKTNALQAGPPHWLSWPCVSDLLLF